MNRPEKKNALSPDMLAGLVLGYEYIDEDPSVRCAVLTGAGGSFCSGMDLVSMGQQSEQKLPPAPVRIAQRTLGVLVDVLVAEHEPGEHVGGERVLLLGPVHREDRRRRRRARWCSAGC